MAEGVVDGPEAVEVDEDERGAGAGAVRLLQGRPGALQEPLTVGQAGQRVPQLLLGPGPGDPERRVQGDQGDGEERQQHGHGRRHHADQRGDAEQGDGDEALAQQRGPGDRRQTAALGRPGVPEQEAGDQEVRAGGEQHFRHGVDAPVEWPPGCLDGRHVTEGGQDEGGRPYPEYVHRPVQQTLPPAVAPGRADEHHDDEADQPGGHPAVEE